ncbi:MAG: acyl-CoA synthetase [Rhodospirillales bacterium]
MTIEGYEENLPQNPANHVPLSPLSFIRRSADIFPDRPALIYGHRSYTWAETYERTVRLASALNKRGIGRGDTVAVLAANTPELFEALFGVPMSGAVVNTINTRLDADTIAYILEHGEARVFITDTQFSPTVRDALARTANKDVLVIDIVDDQALLKDGEGERLGAATYEDLIAEGDVDFAWSLPDDEWQALALNYTSGTSGRPKGVIYHHRGSYLMTMGTVIGWGLPNHPTYLYTVPMFHCNGWGHAWTMAAVTGTVVCCRYITAKNIYDAIAEHRITHFGGAPVVLGFLVEAKAEERKPFDWPIKAMTAGAPPPAAVLEKVTALGFDVMQVYGLTETYGHVVHCAWQEQWDDLPFAEQAEIKARQGVRFPMTEDVEVHSLETGERVPADGETMGEIVIRGNTVMKGYYRNPEATSDAFRGGWYHSGDIAVVHPNGYLQIKDRLKDVIISGGENISSVEVESVLYKHPAVSLAAVVAKPDDKWGETPCAFIEVRAGEQPSEADIIAFCRQHLAGFKCPKRVVFCELPKTSTGKIQKFQLREQAHDLP